MKKISALLVISSCVLTLSSCSTMNSGYDGGYDGSSGGSVMSACDYSTRLPQTISSKERTIYVDPNVHAWGAYADGNLVRAGLATSGGNWCSDVNRPCKTVAGTFHIYKMGGYECRSNLYPVGKGGALMPYCMHFSGSFSLHGSSEMVEGNESHGCVRMTIPDAEWVRYQFASVGTRVVVKPY